MRTVGTHPRLEFELDPAEAWRRGRRLDALLASALPAWPRGEVRAQRDELNRLDDERQLLIARRLNTSPAGIDPVRTAVTLRDGDAA